MFCAVMLSLSPFVMLPFVVAFLISIALSLRYDQVSFRNGPHLALACVAMLAMVSYVALAVGHLLPNYADDAFCVLGLCMIGGVLIEIADHWRAA
jgi:hypothetical protein